MIYDPERHNRRSMRLKGYDYSNPGFYYVTICTQDRVERFGDVQNDKMNLNDAGEMVDAEWNRIPERYEHVVLDKYQIMPNHLHGILQIISQENGRNKPFENESVGTGFMLVLIDSELTVGNGFGVDESINAPVLNDGDETLATGPIDGDKTHATTLKNVIAASERMGTRPIPTPPMYDIIGTFKSLTQNEYADHVRKNGWPPFRKRLWQLRFHDHIIRNDDELNRIRKYIEDNPKNWENDKNNPKNIKENDDTDNSMHRS